MKIISWNVNGINAAIKHGLMDFIVQEKPDIICLQETKAGTLTIPAEIKELKGYHLAWNEAEKKGYSGVLTLVKPNPIKIMKGMDDPESDSEGRLLTVELEEFFLINGYFVNSQRELARLDYKQRFNEKLLDFSNSLRKNKPVILTGDFNVAHTEIDIKNPKQNERNAGFTIEERTWFTKLLDQGYIDTFRMFNQEPGHYTWWSYRSNAREKNIGWRLDYFVVSEELKPKVQASEILDSVLGSDHCPIRLTLKQ